MDNYSSNGSGMSDDLFSFIPPNMMFPDSHFDDYATREEKARREYEIDHTDILHIKDEPPSEITM